jgi:hypothetical protein
LIIKPFSPLLSQPSKSAHYSPDQTDDRIKIYIIFEVPTPLYRDFLLKLFLRFPKKKRVKKFENIQHVQGDFVDCLIQNGALKFFSRSIRTAHSGNHGIAEFNGHHQVRNLTRNSLNASPSFSQWPAGTQ